MLHSEITSTSIDGKHYCVYVKCYRKTIRATMLISWCDAYTVTLALRTLRQEDHSSACSGKLRLREM